MFGAYVLFPYHNEEQFRDHRFYRSIELINVGAFPFLPNSTKLMEAFLDEIIMDSPEKAYERSTRPRGTKDYYQNKFVGKNVLVGSLRDESQLEDALQLDIDYRISNGVSKLDIHKDLRRHGARLGIFSERNGSVKGAV